MRKEGKLFLYVGIGLIISAISIFISDLYFEHKMLSDIKFNIENSKTNIEISNNGSNSTLIDLDESGLGMLDTDQEVEMVETYKNVIEIPHLNILAYINTGSDKKALSSGVGWHEKTTKYGEIGNSVIAGHASDIYRCIFNNLKNIAILENFYIYDSNGIKHTYTVTDKFIIIPEDTSIMSSHGDGLSTITLYTCTERGTRRLVIVGKEFNELQLADFEYKLTEKYINDMVRINDAVSVSNIVEQLDSKSKLGKKIYHISYVASNKDKISSRFTFYSLNLGSNVDFNPHNFGEEYILFGINGGNYDISENED